MAGGCFSTKKYNAMMKIHFEDSGQDALIWELDIRGVVVKTYPVDQAYWHECTVVHAGNLRKGDQVCFYNRDGDLQKTGLRIARIEKLMRKEVGS